MANPEHLAIFEQGVEAWTKWREQTPEIRPDLGEVDFSGSDFSGTGIAFDNVDLFRARLVGTNLSDTNFFGASLYRANLSHANLSDTCLNTADLRRAYLNKANLRGARLNMADLLGADLSGTTLCGARFFAANLRETILRGADLRQADLREAILRGAILEGADLGETDFADSTVGETIFGNVDLSTAKDLATIRHWAPSVVGIDTIYKSKGKIPVIFLRRAGVPNQFIEYIAALVGQPIQFYSCFISYSSLDQDFADRLYADLQNNNVRCWFAPEDMKIGARLRPTIDEAIRLYDKLLLVLSEASINSQWVEQEVEGALEKERDNYGSTVLFPVRLDDAVMTTPAGWAKLVRNTRSIGNFCGWKDHDTYQKALQRLLRDLKAETGTWQAPG